MIKGFKEYLMEEDRYEKHHISVIVSHPPTGQDHVEKVERIMAPNSSLAIAKARKRFRDYGYTIHSVTMKD